MQTQRLSLVPAVGYLHVKAGQILKVTAEHAVPTVTRIHDNPHVRTTPLNGEVLALPSGLFVTARVGDLVLELVDGKGSRTRSYAYLAGPAAGLHRAPDESDADRVWYEPARVERLTKLERFCEELGTDASPERIAELEQIAITELQRARHAELDLALVDIEAGDAYKKAAHAVRVWWREHAPAQPRPDSELTCHLIARLVRNRKLLRARFRKSTGAAYLHSQPTRHAGYPPAPVFHMEALLEATLPS